MVLIDRRTLRIRMEGEERVMARCSKGMGVWLLACCLSIRQVTGKEKGVG